MEQEQVFIHPLADCKATAIGQGTRIWQYVVILPGAQIGSECNICSHVFIEADVVIGDRVTIKNGVQLWDGLRVEDDVFIGPNATFTNDPFPRSKHRPAEYAQTIIHQGASIGANATILPGLVIGQGAMVGAGAVVTRNVPPNAIVTGNPANIRGYADATGHCPQPNKVSIEASTDLMPGVRLLNLPLINDIRGTLSVGEYSRDLPFEPQRYFLVYDVPSREVRGEHAHRSCHQFLVCVRGSLNVMVDNGANRVEVTLDKPNQGLHLPPMTWAVQFNYSQDAMLLVLASEPYAPDDYIREYDEFIRLVAEK